MSECKDLFCWDCREEFDDAEEERVTNPDPNSYIQSSARLLAETLSSKNEDYRVQGEFSNFERAAEFAMTDPMTVMMAQLAIKVTRIEGLTSFGKPNHESLKDSFLDLAGYAIIAHAYLEAMDVDSD